MASGCSKARWFTATLVLSWAGAAAGAPLRAQMAWCEIQPEGGGSNVDIPPFGTTADKRKMWLHFSFAADPGSDGVLDDAEIAAALAETASVEVCSIQAPLVGTSPPTIRCRWSEGVPGGGEWLVYDSAGPPDPGNKWGRPRSMGSLPSWTSWVHPVTNTTPGFAPRALPWVGAGDITSSELATLHVRSHGPRVAVEVARGAA